MAKEHCLRRLILGNRDMTIENVTELSGCMNGGGKSSRSRETHTNVFQVEDENVSVFCAICKICDKPD